MVIHRNIKSEIKNGLNISKIYFIVSVLKFPLVISLNGVINGTLAIFLIGGICSTIGNYLIHDTLKRTGEKNYLGLSQKSMGNYHFTTIICMFIFRCIALFYMVDLSHRLLISMGIELFVVPKYVVIILCLLLMFVEYCIPDPNYYISALTRNSVNILLILTLTGLYAIFNSKRNLNEIYFLNSKNSFFNSFALTFICFAQQISTASHMAMENDLSVTSIILGGIFSSLGYVIAGFFGYSSCLNPNLNWCFNIENNYLRVFSSLVFLMMNVLQYPGLLNPICNDIQAALRLRKNSKAKILLTFIMTVIFVPLGLFSVSSKYLQFPCLIFSALIMIIFPCIFYLKAQRTSNRKDIFALLNMGIGGFFVGKACIDWLQV